MSARDWLVVLIGSPLGAAVVWLVVVLVMGALPALVEAVL